MTHQSLEQRQLAMLQQALGPLILNALSDPQSQEIMINSDGTIWHEVHGRPAVCIGTQDPVQTEAVLRLVATLNGTAIHKEQPSIAGVLPGGERFQGWLNPRTRGPAYCIRVHQAQVLTRAAYVPQCCPAAIWDVLTQAVAGRDTLLLVGGMSSGKTTLANTLISLIPPTTRVVTMEDTAELVVEVPNHLQLYAKSAEELAAMVKDGFRTAAQRCPVGEIRDGVTALHALKLWLAIGGGIATTHADSARDALTRLEYLCAEVSPGNYQPLLGDVIDLIVFLSKDDTTGQRRVAEVLRVKRFTGETYELEVVF